MRRIRQLAWVLTCVSVIVLLGAPPAQSHAFGQRYDLPLPLYLYLAGAGAAVTLSFVIMALIFRAPRQGDQWRGIDLLHFRLMRVMLHPVVIGIIQAFSVGLFLLVLATGFFGTQVPLKNFAPTFVWVIWWVGLAYVAALAGNIWPTINPWSVIFAGLEKLVRRLGSMGPASGYRVLMPAYG